MIKWKHNGENSKGEDDVTGLRLLVEKIGDEFVFNGYKFPTEAAVRAFTEEYARSAILRHKLKPKA